MHSESNFLINLFIILIAGGIGAYTANYFKQPKILGQILGGVIIGPSILNIASHTSFITNLAELGVILLMFLAGLETDFEELKKSFEKSTWIALGGILLPFVFGAGTIMLFKESYELKEVIFTGVMLTATSMGIAIQTLSELGKLKNTFGTSIIGATIIDDVAGVIILAITLGVFGKTASNILMLLTKIALFFVFLVWIAKWFSNYTKKNRKILERISHQQLLFGSLTLVLLFGIFASEFGLAAIIGAYFIGLIISRTQLKHRVATEIERFGTGFFIPIFFVNIGLTVDLSIVSQYFIFALALTTGGIVSKILGSGLGAKISGFSNNESLQVGISMIPRAEVTLIIANLGMKAGLIGPDIFTGAILLVITSSILTPLLLKATDYTKEKQRQGSLKRNANKAPNIG